MKTLFTILFSFLALTAQAFDSFEKCDATEQVPNALVPGTFSRILVMPSEDSWDLVLLMKVKETSEIKSLPMGFVEGTEKSPHWENGSLTMTVDFNLGQYTLFKSQEKILTMLCQ